MHRRHGHAGKQLPGRRFADGVDVFGLFWGLLCYCSDMAVHARGGCTSKEMGEMSRCWEKSVQSGCGRSTGIGDSHGGKGAQPYVLLLHVCRM